MFFRPCFLRFLAQQGQSPLQPNTLLQLFVLVLCCHFFWWTVLARCRSIFFTSSGQTYLTSILTSPSNIKVCPRGHFFTQITCLQSTSLLPKSGWPSRELHPTSRQKASMNKDNEVVLFLPAAPAICLLTLIFLRELSPRQALPTSLLAPYTPPSCSSSGRP